MKLQITLALAAVCVANAGRIQKDAEEFLANQKKLQKVAQNNLSKYTNLAEQEAAKHGFNFDLSAIYSQLGDTYGEDAVESAGEKAAKTVEAQFEARREQFEASPKVAKAQDNVRKFANKATFGGLLNNVKKALSAQVDKIPNEDIAKELNKMLAEGAKQTRNQMKNANIDIDLNIKNTGAEYVKNNQAEWEGRFIADQKSLEKTLKQKLNNGIKNL